MKCRKSIATLLVLSLFGSLPTTAFAGAREHRGYEKDHRSYAQPHRRDDRHYQRTRVGHDDYYFRQGRFFRPGPRGLVSVRAPLGAIVATLPLGFAAVTLGVNTFFCADETYYRRVPQGYMVVEAPVFSSPPLRRMKAWAGAVVVQPALLNIRSGPGMHFAVRGQVLRGEQLMLRGSSSGWYHVEMPGGGNGWVMMQFAQPVGAG